MKMDKTYYNLIKVNKWIINLPMKKIKTINKILEKIVINRIQY